MSRLRELLPTPNEHGTSVVYLMSRDQRVRDNHALVAAQQEAIERSVPLAVIFNLSPQLGYRRREHYEFMVNGLKQVEHDLAGRHIPFVITIGHAADELPPLLQKLNPRSVYCDMSPLKGARRLHQELMNTLSCRLIVVDSHNVVPVWVTSDKEEFAAHTIRRKLHRLIADWAIEPSQILPHPVRFRQTPTGTSWAAVDKAVRAVPRNGTSPDFEPGETAASERLEKFITDGLERYAAQRNNPLADAQSDLSPYLHFGQLSALRVLLRVMDVASEPPQLFRSYKMPSFEGRPTHQDNVDAFVEELIVRKELSDNFCWYNPCYDRLDGARNWARAALADHAEDPREFIYTYQQLADATTHDPLWNAAQLQLRRTGKIHGYMRMYWAKRILEWTDSPATALAWTIELNDTYHLDGGDPNGYVGILWSLAGVHDRPWFNRSVYGTIRYMARSGAEKKFDVTGYIDRWS